jgi:hypothetical protein
VRQNNKKTAAPLFFSTCSHTTKRRRTMASDDSTSAWSALKAAVWRYPALGVLLAMLLPLLGAAAVFLVAGSTVHPQSPWTRATALRDRCSYSEAEMIAVG